MTQNEAVAPAMSAISTEAAPQAIGPYSCGLRVPQGRDLLFVSGQLPLDPASGAMVSGNISAKATRALENGLAIVRAGGADLADIVKVTVFLTDLSVFATVNEAYASFFGDTRPARSVIEVCRLPKDSEIEIEMIATVPDI